MGIKLKPKDPRDYFLGEIVSKIDPITSMHMMRHSSLAILNLPSRNSSLELETRAGVSE